MKNQTTQELDEDLMELIDSMPSGNFLSVKQVAGIVGRCPEYVRGLVESGELRVLNGQGKKRNAALIFRSSLIRYLKDNIS